MNSRFFVSLVAIYSLIYTPMARADWYSGSAGFNSCPYNHGKASGSSSDKDDEREDKDNSKLDKIQAALDKLEDKKQKLEDEINGAGDGQYAKPMFRGGLGSAIIDHVTYQKGCGCQVVGSTRNGSATPQNPGQATPQTPASPNGNVPAPPPKTSPPRAPGSVSDTAPPVGDKRGICKNDALSTKIAGNARLSGQSFVGSDQTTNCECKVQTGVGGHAVKKNGKYEVTCNVKQAPACDPKDDECASSTVDASKDSSVASQEVASGAGRYPANDGHEGANSGPHRQNDDDGNRDECKAAHSDSDPDDAAFMCPAAPQANDNDGSGDDADCSGEITHFAAWKHKICDAGGRIKSSVCDSQFLRDPSKAGACASLITDYEDLMREYDKLTNEQTRTQAEIDRIDNRRDMKDIRDMEAGTDGEHHHSEEDNNSGSNFNIWPLLIGGALGAGAEYLQHQSWNSYRKDMSAEGWPYQPYAAGGAAYPFVTAGLYGSIAGGSNGGYGCNGGMGGMGMGMGGMGGMMGPYGGMQSPYGMMGSYGGMGGPFGNPYMGGSPYGMMGPGGMYNPGAGPWGMNGMQGAGMYGGIGLGGGMGASPFGGYPFGGGMSPYGGMGGMGGFGGYGGMGGGFGGYGAGQFGGGYPGYGGYGGGYPGGYGIGGGIGLGGGYPGYGGYANGYPGYGGYGGVGGGLGYTGYSSGGLGGYGSGVDNAYAWSSLMQRVNSMGYGGYSSGYSSYPSYGGSSYPYGTGYNSLYNSGGLTTPPSLLLNR